MTIVISTNINQTPKEYFANNPNQLIGDVPTMFSIERYELVPGVGALTYIKNAEYPRKGIPTIDVIYNINIVKEVIKQSLRFPLVFINIEKALMAFNTLFDKIYLPYKTNHVYMSYTPRMIWFATSRFLKEIGVSIPTANNFGYNFAQIFEADDAYRHRAEDMMTEANKQQLHNNPRKEIKRLVGILKEREQNKNTGLKIEKMITPLLWILLIPKYRKAFNKSLHFLCKIHYDESDWYWVAFKNNYKFGGKTHEERIKDLSIPEMYVYK